MRIRTFSITVTATLALGMSSAAVADQASKQNTSLTDHQSAIDTARDARQHRRAIRYHRSRSAVDDKTPLRKSDQSEFDEHTPEYLQHQERDKAAAEIEELESEEKGKETD